MDIQELRHALYDSAVGLVETLNHQYNLHEHLQKYSMYHHESPRNGFIDGYLFGLDTAMSAIRHHQEYTEALFDEFCVTEDLENVHGGEDDEE